jgi:hypothetical protein
VEGNKLFTPFDIELNSNWTLCQLSCSRFETEFLFLNLRILVGLIHVSGRDIRVYRNLDHAPAISTFIYPSPEGIEGITDTGALDELENGLIECGIDDVPDCLHVFLRLRSIFKPDATTITLGTIPRIHKSFVDFIREPRQSGYFRVNPTSVHEDLAFQCLRQLRSFPTDVSDICYNGRQRSDSTSSPFHHACYYWEYHLRHTSPDGRNTEAFDNVVRSSLRGWVGVFSVLTSVTSPQNTHTILESASSWSSVGLAYVAR